MDDQKQQIVERLKKANNVLVTVSNDPSVDQLAACIGLTLALNKLDKHATAVFSGNVPSTIEFLKPDETLEKNTDSLRDFIISLDKSKADKLRYKVEDRVVRIFITPYRTSISDQDLEFSQGDFNVDVVLALGVHEQKDLDQAITAHGRILHDATVVTVNNQTSGDLGGINWLDTNTSSLSEMAAAVVAGLGKDILDEQISTALLTGIVAETDRFSNQKTSADTMQVSAALMAAGANQQLVATELQEPAKTPGETPLSEEMPLEAEKPAEEELAKVQISDDGTLEINHKDEGGKSEPETPKTPPATEPSKPAEPAPQPAPSAEVEKPPTPAAPSDAYANPRTALPTPPNDVAQPAFTSALQPGPADEPLRSPLDLPPVADTQGQQPLIGHANDTLQDLEREVNSPHLKTDQPPASTDAGPKLDADGADELDLSKLETPAGLEDTKPAVDIDAARDAVAQAMAESGDTKLEPVAALNAQPLAANLNTPAPTEPVSLPAQQPLADPKTVPGDDPTMTMPLPPAATSSATDSKQPNPSAAPPVPPPIIPLQ